MLIKLPRKTISNTSTPGYHLSTFITIQGSQANASLHVDVCVHVRML